MEKRANQRLCSSSKKCSVVLLSEFCADKVFVICVVICFQAVDIDGNFHFFPAPTLLVRGLACLLPGLSQMGSPEAQAGFLANFRADSIVEDCEAVRGEKESL